MKNLLKKAKHGIRKVNSNPKISLLIKILIGAGLLGVILYFIDSREAFDIIKSANPWYMLAYGGWVYLDRALMAYKWKPLLTAINVRMPYFPLLRMYSAAPLVGIILPSTIGGDLFRLYSLSRYKVKAGAIISSIVVERVIGFVALLVPTSIALVLASIMFKDKWDQFAGIVWALLIILLVGVITFWAMRGFIKNWIDHFANKYAGISIVNKIHYMYTMFSEYRNHWRVIGFVFVLTVIEQMAPIVATFFLVSALNIDVAFWKLMVVVPIVILMIRMPLPLDVIGVREGINVILFGLIGFSVEEAVLMTLLSRVLDALCALPWGIQYLLGRHGPTPTEDNEGKSAVQVN